MKKSNPNRELLPAEKKTPKNAWTILLLAAATVASCLLYFYLVLEVGPAHPLVMQITFYAYFAICGVAIVAYFIYNRGLVGHEITAEMLPSSMDWAEKKAYLEEIAERKRKSRAFIFVLFVFLVPLMLDLSKLFIIDRLFPDLF